MLASNEKDLSYKYTLGKTDTASQVSASNELRSSLSGIDKNSQYTFENAKNNNENMDPKMRALIANHSKEKALLEQKLELTQMELKETKQSYEEYKLMSDRILDTLNQSSPVKTNPNQLDMAKEMYLREIVEIKHQNETEVHKLELTIGKCF